LADLIIKGIKRLNEFTDPELLEPTEVTKFENMILNSIGGKAVKRGGINIFEGNAAGGRHYSLHDCITSAGVNYILSAISTKVRKLNVATNTWSDLKTGLTTNKKTRISSYGDKYILTNGTDTPFITDLSSAWDLTIDEPNIQAVTAARASAGSLTVDKRYRWILVYVTSTGDYSQPSKPFGFTNSTLQDYNTTETTYLQINFSNLPVSSDTRVTGRLLFRTEGNGSTYYLVTALDNTDTTYNDGNADADLDTSYLISYLADFDYAKYSVSHLSRLFFANIKLKYLTITPPAHVPFTATNGDHGSNAIDEGTYRYKVTFLNSKGRESVASTYVEVVADAAMGITDNQITLQRLPFPRIGAGDFDPDITHIRIYRTKEIGTYGSTNYYWVADNGRTDGDYIDITNDTSLTTAYPKSGTGKYDEESSAKKSAVIFSNIGKISEFPPENMFNIYPDDGDEITGIFSEPDGIIVFKTNSICKLYTQGSPASWRVIKIIDNMGCDNGESIVKAGSVYYFLNKKLVYRFNGNSKPEPVGIHIINSLSAITTFYDAIYNIKKNWYILTGDDTLFIYDEIIGTWYIWNMSEPPVRYCLCDKIHGSTAGTFLLGGDSNEKTLYYNSSGSLDYSDTSADSDALITPVIRTKTFTFPDSNFIYRLRKLLANYKKLDDNPVKHTLHDPDSGYNKYISDTTNSTLTSDYKQFIQDTGAMSASGTALLTGKKLYYQIESAGLLEFNSADIKHRIISRGRRD